MTLCVTIWYSGSSYFDAVQVLGVFFVVFFCCGGRFFRFTFAVVLVIVYVTLVVCLPTVSTLLSAFTKNHTCYIPNITIKRGENHKYVSLIHRFKLFVTPNSKIFFENLSIQSWSRDLNLNQSPCDYL